MNGKRLFLLGAVGAIAGVTAIIGGAWWNGGGAPASAQVEVRQEGTKVGTQAAGSALKDASDKIGFEVLPLAGLPDPALALKFVDAHLGPTGVTNGLKYAVLGYENPANGSQVTVSEFNVRMTHPANDASVVVDLGIPGVEVWKSAGQAVTVYTLLTANRTYDLVVSGRPEFSSDDLAKLAVSLK